VLELKCILIICDGMGDRPCKTYPKTPLETANTPALNELTRHGISGIMDPIKPGIRPGSDTAHLSLFGYDPYVYYKGRGPFEAIGAGVDVKPGEIAIRANFATIDSNDIIKDRRAGRSIPEGDEFAKLLANLTLSCAPDVKPFFIHTVEHRGVLKLQGPHLSSAISDMDPDVENVKVMQCYPLDGSPEAKRTAEIMNEFYQRTKEILMKSPLNEERKQKNIPLVNAILLRGAGIAPKLRTLPEIYHIRAACICGAPLYRGVAKIVGMIPIIVPEATGTIKTNTLAKGKAALDHLNENDFIFIHVKGTDSASHDGNYANKVMMIEKIDAMVKLLLDKINLEETIIAITADHADPICIRDHTADPVPITLAGNVCLSDNNPKFSEKSCAKGGLGRIRGLDLMPILMDLIDHIKKFGA
jgi:2,3-bisphosphoglycerate-independent phosphoglycerate mutase